MADGDVPDLLDETGRLRRLAIAFVIAVLAAGVAYFVCDQLATPDELRPGSQRGAYRFVYYVTGLTFAVVLTAVHAFQKWLVRRAELRDSGLPRAKLR